MDRIEDFKDNKIKLKQKLILVLRELLLDLSRHVDVEYIHCFRIVESNLINSLFDFEYINNILLNCFFFPAINIDMESFNKVLVGQYLLDKTKRFVFVKKEHGLCFYVSFHEIQTNTFYFFLFRGHSVLSHDPFFSFEQFCVFNNLRILPVNHSREFLDYEVTDNEIFFILFKI